MKTKVINLISGPGCGKSTLAAELYAVMKKKGMNVEMVREVAKEWAWEGKKIGPFEQLAILGDQIKKESSLFGKVEYIVTDSPVLLGAYYFCRNHGEVFAFRTVTDYYRFCKRKDIEFFNYVLSRTKKYDRAGRYENEEQAKQIDQHVFDHAAIIFGAGVSKFNKKLTSAKIIKMILEDLK